MMFQTHSVENSGLSLSVRNWLARYAGEDELIIAYGGMQAVEIQHLLEKASDSCRIFWLERYAPVLEDEFRQLLDDRRLLVSSAGPQMAVEFFEFFNPKADLAFVLLSAGRSSEEDERICMLALRALRERIFLDVFNTGTLVSKGLLWQNNTLQNLPRILRSPGVGALRNRFVGRPAVVCGAGPSLNEVIPSLKALQDRFVIISTGTALAPLRAAGIRPDLVIAVDGSELIARQFMVQTDDLYFIGSTIVYPGITHRFKGSFYSFLDANPIDQWVKENSAADGHLHAGGTVTACGMDVAMDMGCDPVITVGLDLAYGNDGSSHANGTMYNGIRAPRHYLVPIEGNWEERVYTTKQFECYVKLISQYVNFHAGKRFINLTNGGAKIDGLETRRVEALEAFAGELFDAYAEIGQVQRAYRPEKAAQALESLKSIFTYLNGIQTLCMEGAMAGNRLLMMMRHSQYADAEEMQLHLRKMQEIDGALEQGGEYDFIKMSLWGAAYELAVKPQDFEKKFGERELVLSRAKRFYEQVAGAAKWSRELIGRACRDLEQKVA
jgi:hypothetical protein